ncbi:hypothetical protein CEXT_306831 [Caerostris extrusa]|uniref:Uncharacterized protein n=1 Tax=Caerostris extrusa TaxID=172846 RepID=A0AAV4QHU5_CAEEX|nr:hypothetical protein CEXT_306831 [Caerostris extrusa]
MKISYLPGTGVILDQAGGSPEQRPIIALRWADVRHIRKLRLLGVHNFCPPVQLLWRARLFDGVRLGVLSYTVSDVGEPGEPGLARRRPPGGAHLARSGAKGPSAAECNRFVLSSNVGFKVKEVNQKKKKYHNLICVKTPMGSLLGQQREFKIEASKKKSLTTLNKLSTMKQDMLGKTIKRGYKIWARPDASSGFMYQFEVYPGKKDDGAILEELGYRVITNLTNDLHSTSPLFGAF